MDIKLTEINKELTVSTGAELVYVVDVNDSTEGPNGTSKKMKLNVIQVKDDSISRDKLSNELKARVTADVSSTYAIDRSLGVVFELTMTADTTFTDANLVSGTDTNDILILLSGNFVPTFPVYWELTPTSDPYKVTVRNFLTVSTINGDTQDIIYQLQNLAT
tara:strand:+ start:4307 stop:4792 length:486 start_codon:yes stop_codon:yes gene_type:complete